MPLAPKFGIGVHVSHAAFGIGKILAYDAQTYVIIFKGPEVRRVDFSFENLKPAAEGVTGDPELDRIKLAVREVLGDFGFLDSENEMSKRWVGGVAKLIPGKEGTQPKDIPLEALFKKIIGIRDKLRVLEQKVNAHAVLTPEEKVELEGYISRCYGSLTSFNSLFAEKESQFKGTGE